MHADDLLTPAAAAAIAMRSVRTIRRAYMSGRLSAYRDRSGRGVRILYGDLRRWMMGEEIAPRDPRVQKLPMAPTSGGVPPRARGGDLRENLALLRAARDSRRRAKGRISAGS